MKPGDLVRLSAYGLSRQYNNFIVFSESQQTGLIIEVKETWTYGYKVQWTKATGRGPAFSPGASANHSRKELKYAYR